MHRYEELLRRYYIKKVIKIVIFLLFLGIALFLALKFLKNSNPQKSVTPKKEQKVVEKEPKKEVKKEKKIVLEKKKIEFILPKIEENRSIKSKEKIVKKEIKKTKIIQKSLTLKEMIDRFNKTQKYELAIMISKEYLKRGELKNAKIWALRANELNAKDPDSWILFADILLKEGRSEKAIEVLNTYIDSYGKNDKIEEKLRSIK